MSDPEKKNKLKKIKTKQYRIYGIFNFEKEEIVFVHMDMDKITFEFDLEGYDENRFGIISFDVLLN